MAALPDRAGRAQSPISCWRSPFSRPFSLAFGDAAGRPTVVGGVSAGSAGRATVGLQARRPDPERGRATDDRSFEDVCQAIVSIRPASTVDHSRSSAAASRCRRRGHARHGRAKRTSSASSSRSDGSGYWPTEPASATGRRSLDADPRRDRPVHVQDHPIDGRRPVADHHRAALGQGAWRPAARWRRSPGSRRASARSSSSS